MGIPAGAINPEIEKQDWDNEEFWAGIIPEVEEIEKEVCDNKECQAEQIPDIEKSEKESWDDKEFWAALIPEIEETEKLIELQTEYMGMTIHRSLSRTTAARNRKRKIFITTKIKGICPLDALFWTREDAFKATEFERWMKKGRLLQSKMTDWGLVYFKSQCNDLKSNFNFKVYEVIEKSWFLPFCDPGFPFLQSHVDVIFYYMRKFAFYSNSAPLKRVTTTDVYFDQLIDNMYFKYVVDTTGFIVDIFNPITEYIAGSKLICGKSWLEVDHILFPIHIADNEVGHWILGRLSFEEMKFYVYNSIQTNEVDHRVAEVVKRYTVMLPKIFQKLRNYAMQYNFGIGAHEKNEFNAPLILEFVERLPIQKPRDCGVHMASYAEYFISNAEIPIDFDVDIHRKRFGCLLYNHAIFKADNGYVSGDETEGYVNEE